MRGSWLLGLGLLVAGMMGPTHVRQKPTRPAPSTGSLLERYCQPCHSGSTPAGGVALLDPEGSLATRAARNVASGTMPPPGARQPTAAERKRLVADFDARAARKSAADPGRVTLRRLNRTEYNNTIRDLVGVDFRPGDDFPSDDIGYGFDSIGDVLSLSPLLMEKYLDAAEKIAGLAIVSGKPMLVRVDAGEMPETQGNRAGDGGGRWFTSNGSTGASFDIREPGTYRIRVQAWGQQAGPEPCRLAVAVDNRVLATFDIRATEGSPTIVEMPNRFENPGMRRITVGFTNDYYQPNDPKPSQRDRNLAVDWLEVEGPLGPRTLPASHTRIVTTPGSLDHWDRPMAEVLGAFASRAFRRPATKAEVDGLVALTQKVKSRRGPVEEGVRLGVTAILASPSFLFRVEPSTAGVRALNAYEVATRLSYFLWSTMPDSRLFELSKSGKLTDPKVLDAEVDRMLLDPKAAALAENFAMQWLELRKLAAATPDPSLFPSFDDRLRSDMAEETQRFFRTMVSEDRSVLEFLDADWTILNGPLAKLYGISGIEGREFRRVKLSGSDRGGILTHASVLTVTSNPNRTSPVKRGKWVLENLLGSPPPPPPPGAGTLAEAGDAVRGKTVRERLELHRKDPNCASCHARMDPIGFGLESFDPIGRRRAQDEGAPIDDAGVLTDGTRFKGPAELRRILLGRKSDFVRCLSEKLMTYALGRGPTSDDAQTLDRITATLSKNDYRFSVLIKAIVRSDAFLKRMGDGGPKQR